MRTHFFSSLLFIQIGDQGNRGGTFIWNHLVHVGRYTYTSTENGKYFNVVEQLVEGLTGAGRLLALDNAFPTIKLLQVAKTDWNTAIVATQAGNTKHLAENHVNILIILLFSFSFFFFAM